MSAAVKVPALVLGKVYAALQAAEKEAKRESPPSALWGQLMEARVDFRIYVMDEIKADVALEIQQ